MTFDGDSPLNSVKKLNAVKYPDLGTGPVPAEPYVSEEFLAKEREKIFRKMWLLVGRVERIPNAGDYFVKKIEILNTSIIVVRGNDGLVRAFYNVCRHRGTNVAQGAGNCKYFTCNFHGWVYDTHGVNRHVADESQFHNLDKSKLNLQAVHCEVWNGFIFINVDEEPRETLVEQLAELGEQLAEFPFSEMEARGNWGATLKANWKLFLDAFQEGYHVATVHSGTINTYYTGARNPHCRPSSVRLYERNRSLTIPFNPDFKIHPSEEFAVSVGESLSQGEAGLSKVLPGANPEGDEFYSFDINAIFPNWLLDTSVGFYFIHEFWPIDATTTRWEATMFFPPAANASALISQEQSVALLRDAFREDISTSEGSQAGLNSGSLQEINFADTEISCRHLYEVVTTMVSESE
ncbi:MAG: aromatic ring-hydroxylating dioxygenase subunit alpha [Pseudomonadota bacterium]